MDPSSTVGSLTALPGSGVWESPFGDSTVYVAFLLDDSSLTKPLLATGINGSVGFYVTNDDDGAGSGTAG